MNLRMKQKTPTKTTNEWMKNCTKWHLFKYRCYDTTGNHTRISYQKKKYGWINSKSKNRNKLTTLVDGAKIRIKLREWKQSTVMHLLYQLNLLHIYVYINVAEIHKIVHIKNARALSCVLAISHTNHINGSNNRFIHILTKSLNH